MIGDGARVARVKGKNIRVPAEMTYADYRRVFVDKNLTLKDWQETQGKRVSITLPPSQSNSSAGKISWNFDIQRFCDKLPDDNYNLTVRRQVQNRHIAGTKEHQAYLERLKDSGFKPSFLLPTVDVARLVRDFHKKGTYDPNPKDGSPREIVDVGEVVGKYWNNRTAQYEETTFIEIVYSKSGVHIYPIFPRKKEGE